MVHKNFSLSHLKKEAGRATHNLVLFRKNIKAIQDVQEFFYLSPGKHMMAEKLGTFIEA
jgi:hypothetical protein